ncbi:hypothetical protein G6703_01650 [Polynucleobacter paneuropaeus]|nr:hypothetical protein G6703_01650 [Polynucleobacter paneuropaeus]
MVIEQEGLIATQYFPLKIIEYKPTYLKKTFFGKEAVGGGAIDSYSGGIIQASSNGDFYFVDLATLSIKDSYLPKLDLGIDDFLKSRYRDANETLPRLHSINIASDYLYVTYNKYVKNLDAIIFCLDRIGLKGINNSWENMYTSPPVPTNFYTIGQGGAIAIKATKLYFSIGDYGLGVNKSNDLFPSQNDKEAWGKIIELDLNTKKAIIYSRGHRNPQGIFIDKTGQIIEAEHGPRGGDEINIIKLGKNYGWPIKSYGTGYGIWGGYSTDPDPKYEEPIYTFIPSIAPTKLIQSETIHPRWSGNFLLASLKALSLFNIKIKDGRVIYVEKIYIGERIRDVIEISGELWLLTDKSSLIRASLIKVEPYEFVDDIGNKKEEIMHGLSRCTVCHTLDSKSQSGFAPSLKNVYGNSIGSDSYKNYSAGIKLYGRGKVWSDKNLRLFLKNPQNFIPGTNMPNLNLQDDEAENVIKMLKKLKNEKQ